MGVTVYDVAMTKTLIFLDNGQSVQTDGSHAADIAGLINEGLVKSFTVIDLFPPHATHYIVTSHIVDVFEETTP
jgi:hypothetical protein